MAFSDAVGLHSFVEHTHDTRNHIPAAAQLQGTPWVSDETAG